MNAENGTVECGFYKNDLPFGKHVKFDLEGNEIEEGIYKGHSKAKDTAIESFTFNVGSLWEELFAYGNYEVNKMPIYNQSEHRS